MKAPVRIQWTFHRLLSSTISSTAQKANPLLASALEDQCILVDQNDNVTGEASKSDCHMVSRDGKLLLHRAFSVFLFNSSGDLLLQKRASSKASVFNKSYGNLWDSYLPLFSHLLPIQNQSLEEYIFVYRSLIPITTLIHAVVILCQPFRMSVLKMMVWEFVLLRNADCR